jgi:hypothetical protein
MIKISILRLNSYISQRNCWIQIQSESYILIYPHENDSIWVCSFSGGRYANSLIWSKDGSMLY